MSANALPHTPESFCAQRGISLTVANSLRWQVKGHHLLMPVYDLDGNLRQVRRKNLRHAPHKHEAKYDTLKVGGVPQDVTYKYYHGRADLLRQGVADAGGRLLIANGEPAAAAMMSAGMTNVCSIGFGESNIPADLIEWLTSLGVTTVIYCPDRDDQGRRAATKLRRSLFGSPIAFDCRQLPDTLADKADLNDLWQAVGFDVNAFAAALHDLCPFAAWYALPAAPKKPTPVRAFSGSDGLSRYAEYTAEVRAAVESRQDSQRSGRYIYYHCPVHQDVHPSFRITERGVPVCSCDIQHESRPWEIVAAALGMPDYKTWRSQRYPLSAPPNDHSLSQPSIDISTSREYSRPQAGKSGKQAHPNPYLPADIIPRSGVVLIKAPMGTGKTEAVFNLVRELGLEVLCITHRVALATGQSTRAYRSGLNLASYKDVAELAQLAQIGSLAICINTLTLAAKSGCVRPRMKVVILDEIKQLLRAIGDEYGTLGGDARIALQLLMQAIREADLVLAMDAHADEWTANELALLSGKPVQWVVHEGDIERPPVSLYADRRALRDALPTFLKGTLAVACASEREAREVFQELAPHVPEEKRLLLTGKNANAEKQRAFLANPDAEAPGYDLIVFSPVIGTGVSIMTPVDTLVLLDGGGHLTGEDLAQMAGRFRRARRIAGWIRPNITKQRMTAEEVKDYLIKLERYDRRNAGHRLELDDDGRCVLPKDLTDFYGFQARVMVENWRGKDQALSDFVKSYTNFDVDCTRGNKAAQAARKERQAAAIEALIARANEVKLLSKLDYDKRCEAQGVTEDDDAAYFRWLIEDITGIPYSVTNGRALFQPKTRLALRRLSYSAVENAVLADQDDQDLLAGRLVLNRSRRVLWAKIGRIIRTHLLHDGEFAELSAAELAQLDTELMLVISDDTLQIVVFGYDRAPKTAAGRVRAICRALGLTLDKSRHEEQQNGKRPTRNTYHLEANLALTALNLAEAIGQRVVGRWYEEADSHQNSESSSKETIRKSGGTTTAISAERSRLGAATTPMVKTSLRSSPGNIPAAPPLPYPHTLTVPIGTY